MLPTGTSSRRGPTQFIKLEKWKHGSVEGWKAKRWSLFLQAGVRCSVSFSFWFCFFKEQELGFIVFVEHRVKENKGQQAEFRKAVALSVAGDCRLPVVSHLFDPRLYGNPK